MARSAVTPKQTKHTRLKKSGFAKSASDFNWLCKNTTDRIGIVSEGDSWFAYPPSKIFIGKRSNIIDWVAGSIRNTGKANLLRLESNGDEASAMMSGEQKHKLAEILKKNGSQIHLLLFSAGGNDVVGKWDMERLLKQHQTGYTAEDCIHQDRFKRKLKRVELAYQELIELCEEYSPTTRIVTHTYDAVKPSEDGANFLWGLVKTKPWIYPFLKKKGIPDELHQPIASILLESLRDQLMALAARPKNKNRFFVVNTYGTLRPGDKRDWINEIHPTSSGFKKITKPIYAEMKRLEPSLPKMKLKN